MEIHQKKIVEAAQNLGIEIENLSSDWHMDIVLLRYKEQERFSIKGRVFSGLSHQANMIADNKQACKEWLKRLKIPIPQGLVFEDAESARDQIQDFLSNNPVSVCKPLAGTEGAAVAMDLQRADQVVGHWRCHRHRFDRFLLETQARGYDLRIQAISGNLVAACTREPTRIMGNGQATVEQLIEMRNREIEAQNPENHIDVDDEALELLANQGYNLNSIPAQSTNIALKKVANMAQGAHAIDVTETIHAKYFDWVKTIAQSLDCPIFSLDAMTADHRLDPEQATLVLEINARPAWLHHTFSEGRRHKIPELILKSLFSLQ